MGRRHRLALGQQGKGGKGKQPLLCTWTELVLVPYLELNKLSVAELPELARPSKPVKLNVFKATKPRAPTRSKPGCYRHRALACLLCFYLMLGREVNKMLLTTLLQTKLVLIRENQASSESLCLHCQDLCSLCKDRTGPVRIAQPPLLCCTRTVPLQSLGFSGPNKASYKNIIWFLDTWHLLSGIAIYRAPRTCSKGRVVAAAVSSTPPVFKSQTRP